MDGHSPVGVRFGTLLEKVGLAADPDERHNLADRPDRQDTLTRLRAELETLRRRLQS